MPWAGIGKTTVSVLLVAFVFSLLRIAELWSGDDNLRVLYRMAVQMSVSYGVIWLVFRRGR